MKGRAREINTQNGASSMVNPMRGAASRSEPWHRVLCRPIDWKNRMRDTRAPMILSSTMMRVGNSWNHHCLSHSSVCQR